MVMISSVATFHGYDGKRIVGTGMPPWEVPTWILWSEQFSESLSPLEAIFRRVDEAIVLMKSPLDAPQQDSASYVCPTCGSPMIQEDGGEGFYCSQGCVE